MGRDDTITFRLQPAIKGIVAGAGLLWMVLLGVLLAVPGAVPARTYLGAAFFVVLFGGVLLFYQGFTLTADRYGVTYRGLLTFRSYPYESMLKLDIRTGLSGLVSYDVVTREGLLQFSSFIRGHRRLVELIVERADLARRGRVEAS